MTKKQKGVPYKATAKVMGKVYEATGNTVAEAIGALSGVKNARGQFILAVEHGDTRRERVLMPNIAFRLFNASQFVRNIALKQVSQLFT